VLAGACNGASAHTDDPGSPGEAVGPPTDSLTGAFLCHGPGLRCSLGSDAAKAWRSTFRSASIVELSLNDHDH
jgi:hypothetical protein